MSVAADVGKESAPNESGPRSHSKKEILDVAERLFAERGFSSVSIRDITSAAGVNVAGVTYHFGSKEGLIRAVITRILKSLNEERFRTLRELEERAQGGQLNLREVLYAYYAPAMRYLGAGASQQARIELFTQVFVLPDPHMRRSVEKDVGHLRQILIYIARAVPGLSYADLCWGLHFASGIFHHNTLVHLARLKNFSNGACVTTDIETLIRRAADFAASGFEAWVEKAKRQTP